MAQTAPLTWIERVSSAALNAFLTMLENSAGAWFKTDYGVVRVPYWIPGLPLYDPELTHCRHNL